MWVMNVSPKRRNRGVLYFKPVALPEHGGSFPC